MIYSWSGKQHAVSVLWGSSFRVTVGSETLWASLIVQMDSFNGLKAPTAATGGKQAWYEQRKVMINNSIRCENLHIKHTYLKHIFNMLIFNTVTSPADIDEQRKIDGWFNINNQRCWTLKKAHLSPTHSHQRHYRPTHLLLLLFMYQEQNMRFYFFFSQKNHKI